MAAIGASRLMVWAGGVAVLEAAQPLHLGPQDDDLAEDEEDAEHQHAQDHRVQGRRVHEHADQIVVQQVGVPRQHRLVLEWLRQLQVSVSHAHTWSYATRLSSLLVRQSIPSRALAMVGSK